MMQRPQMTPHLCGRSKHATSCAVLVTFLATQLQSLYITTASRALPTQSIGRLPIISPASRQVCKALTCPSKGMSLMRDGPIPCLERELPAGVGGKDGVYMEYSAVCKGALQRATCLPVKFACWQEHAKMSVEIMTG